jgi:hypothetical protein
VNLIIGPRHPLQTPTETAGEVDVVLTLATLDPALGADHVARWATDAVVFVTAGKASSSALRGVREMLRLAGVRLRSCILIDPDATDESLGGFDAGGQPSEDGSAGPPQMLWLSPQ